MAVLVCNEDLPEWHNRVSLTDRIEADAQTVSYTHLTLPTILLV